jgi:transposase
MIDYERNVVKRLSEGELDRLQAEADEIKEYKRLTFLTRLYDGATLAAADEDVGTSRATAGNWVTRWNEGGLGKLTPNFGGCNDRDAV